MKSKWVMANWKMNGNRQMISEYIDELQQTKFPQSLNVVIFPPVIYFDIFAQATQLQKFSLGAQNVASESAGAYTGEISAAMLHEYNCQYVLIGHSERRHLFKEEDESLAKKFQVVRDYGMIPVFCIGETLQDYQNKQTRQVLTKQLESLAKNTDFSLKGCIIAYEPVWAIGTGLTPTQNELKQIFSDLKEIIKNVDSNQDVPLLYGGSVNENNIAMVNNIADCSGVLIGGASLKIKQLLEIIKCITYC